LSSDGESGLPAAHSIVGDMELLRLFIQHIKANPTLKEPLLAAIYNKKAIISSNKDRRANAITLLSESTNLFPAKILAKFPFLVLTCETVSFTEKTSAEQI
jgi:hypothetical protein